MSKFIIFGNSDCSGYGGGVRLDNSQPGTQIIYHKYDVHTFAGPTYATCPMTSDYELTYTDKYGIVDLSWDKATNMVELYIGSEHAINVYHLEWVWVRFHYVNIYGQTNDDAYMYLYIDSDLRRACEYAEIYTNEIRTV